jgi:hypothetical protein
MKKLYALAILLAFAFGAQAQVQRSYTPSNFKMKAEKGNPSGMSAQALIDSVLFPKFYSSTEAYCDTLSGYFSDNGGFLSGNNGYGDLEKLMKFKFPATGTVTGLQVSMLKYTTAGTGTTQVYAAVYNPDNDGYPDSSTRVLSTPITMRLLPANGIARFVFPNPAVFADSFFVSLVLPQVDGDTILVFQSRFGATRHPDDCASTDTAGYERASDGTFLRVADSWGANFEFGMAPTIRYDDVTAVKNHLAQLVKVSPVPSSKSVSVTLPSNLQGAVSWQILSTDGRVMSQASTRTSGALVQVNRGTLSAGVYSLRLNTVGGTVNKRIVFAD